MAPRFRVERLFLLVVLFSTADIAISEEKYSTEELNTCQVLNRRLDAIEQNIVTRLDAVVANMDHNYQNVIDELQGAICKNGEPKSIALINGPDHKVPDSAMTSSGNHDRLPNFGPQCSRMGLSVLPAGCYSTWTGDVRHKVIWIQVDVGSFYKVVSVATQGRDNRAYNQYVKTYNLAAIHGTNVEYYTDPGKNTPKVFIGNSDMTSIVRHSLEPPMCAQFIRLYVLTYSHYPSTRWELYGYHSSCGPSHATRQIGNI